jgi:hypothetical protein
MHELTLKLDVTMDNVTFVQVLYGKNNLCENPLEK